MKIVVISADYPAPDNVYGDVFVHTRLKQYQQHAQVNVIGFNAHLQTDREYAYDGIDVLVTKDLEKFCNRIISAEPDVLIGHLIQGVYADFLLRLNIPLIVFVHGYEALSWRRRMMNYRSLGDIRYLVPYMLENRKQLSKMKMLAKKSNEGSSVHFVFVSNWLRKAVEEDFGMSIKSAHVIPNGIDTKLFEFNIKSANHRKKILLIRSFKAHNYANDLSLEAILLLQKKDFFNDLEFAIYGEGYLFDKLTHPLRTLPNVKLYNTFTENKNIPAIHKDYGIFLCPSRLDTQGVSMCEAMSSGLVPITSPIGGIPEYATDEVSSYQVRTSEEVADKIEHLYKNPDTFLMMSQQARKAIETRCSITKTIPREMNLIHSSLKRMERPGESFQQCTQCVLDTHDDPAITFNEAGVCSYCQLYEQEAAKLPSTSAEAAAKLIKTVEQIKAAGKGKPYDCIMGLSGGVDSTYLALQAKRLGLRPLAVHFDNGWNSELAVQNIENIVSKLNIDLHTLVVDWDEFKDLQLAFIKASVIDIELATDHAILATLYKLALEKDIQYVLSGHNIATELVLPTNWYHDKRDHIHVQAINKQFGTIPLKTYPLMTSFMKFHIVWKQIQGVTILNYMHYNKKEVKETIQRELGWRDYGGKHYESIFTRFYQGYVLIRKFHVDKRKAHLSNLISSGQMTREEVLHELEKPPYPQAQFEEDYNFVLKKFNLSREEFETLMNREVRKHTDYEIDTPVYDRYVVLKILQPFWKAYKKLRDKVNPSKTV